MMTWIARTIANACGLAVATWLFSGIRITGDSTGDRVLILLVVALLFGIVIEFIRPIVSFLSIPLYLVTLGLFFFVVNALMLLLVSWVADKLDIGFHVSGFWTAVFGAMVISFVSWWVGLLLPSDDKKDTITWSSSQRHW
jgi:putative membrane protein